MEFSIAAIALTFIAGITSVLSPCVLPVIPIVVTGSDKDSQWRPLYIVGGISITFILMGILTALFGGFIGEKVIYLEKVAAVMLVLFGVLLMFDINPVKYITFFNRFQQTGERKTGNMAAMIMGMTLGLVWIPCVGGQLGAVLTMVATKGHLATGVILLLIYSVGFAIPLLLAAFASQIFRKQMVRVMNAPLIIRFLSGALLVGFGLYIWFQGMLGFQLM